ncbi:MAG: bifunctional hydroxymethylpyrimidine kinase/phosphomethylpyrimidine kinase [Brevinematia bacterium]
MEKERVALTIAGSDSGGGAGVQIDLKTFNEIGVFGASVITSLTAQNTLGVQEVYYISPDFVKKQLESVFSDLNVHFSKTGMLATLEIVEVVIEYIGKMLKKDSLKGLVVDPVMKAKGGEKLLKEEAISALRSKLLPLSLVVTPNIPEAELLTGMKIKTEKDMEKSALLIHKMGPRYVVIKGGHLEGEYATDIIFDGYESYKLRSKKYFKDSVHGTGCCFSSAITAFLTKGETPINSIRKAKKFVSNAIKNGVFIGNGFKVLKTY